MTTQSRICQLLSRSPTPNASPQRPSGFRPVRAAALVLSCAAAVFASAACSGSTEKVFSASAFRAAARSDPAPAIAPGRAILAKDLSIVTVAASDRYLVWESAGPEEHPVTLLMQRDLETEKVKELSDATLPSWGLASTATWVVYVADKAPPQLVAVRHDGSDRTVLSDKLIVPIDARGTLVAWAEGDSSHHRVVVREMETGAEWVAADMPSCPQGRCYRIDKVTLAHRGLIFSRGAIGSHPSIIVRRAFDDPRPTSVSVPGDPQPDLVRSSAGAFYYQLRRGWIRWDFGERRPRLIDLQSAVSSGPVPLDYQQGRLLLATGLPCKSTLIIRGGGRTFRLPAPVSTPYSPREFGPLCRQLTSAFWSGNKLLGAWAVLPKLSVESHGDVGLVGVAVAARTPS
jgi:hypothetical protein